MKTVKHESLFTDLTAQEAATVSGAWGHYYRPVYYCYPVSWGGSSSSSPSVSQTVNVTVKIDD